MSLFINTSGSSFNLLPRDGTLNYYGKILSKETADLYFQRLLDTIEWRQDEVVMFGKKILTQRKVSWYSDFPYEYTYSHTTKKALPWTDTLRILKKIIEKTTRENYNSCLLNLYHNGKEGMGWHSDAEKDLKAHAAIGVISLGADRKFSLKHKHTQEKVNLGLEHGSLLVMKDQTQDYWLHSLPPTKKSFEKRISLTFRTII
ncbi:alpha-ketoglutarate-dependent dioxygenase AlkB [Elizabethkingia argentiflava]|uniref:Alpha-ketoglutarate-dependent dioxygenase AlkB n=1 Tax=Elizabethkingia argenteiflava TaxID=2681556 RepID=A0A845PRN4_9FLAO|nr:alpha-ketoglutarate-dependent dioxygenase AlkB [Elizabethkingia argenteiflava]NAW50862.1 alpha-ketoglutarate-dependent dioxygenase AlkB [Elizabethkingia argenteiflava]